MHDADTGNPPVPSTRRAPRAFGTIRRLPSGRYQASYLDPDKGRRTAPQTFRSRQDADEYLAKTQTTISAGRGRAEAAGAELFGGYATRWLAHRRLKDRTREHYGRILDRLILPHFGDARLSAISVAAVQDWYAALLPDKPTMRAHAYGLLRGILHDAVRDDLIVANPCRIRGAGQTKRKLVIRPATLAELETIAAAMPARLQALVLLAAWCGLRQGELTGLQRADVDLMRGVVHVRRGAVRVAAGWKTTSPKSQAGLRDVAMPPHLTAVMADHLACHVAAEPDALVFTGTLGGFLPPATIYESYYPARVAAGRPDLRFHDLRHTGATLAAATGATLADLMARLGHSTAGAAMRYQHASADRDAAIAAALGEMYSARVVPLKARTQA